MEYPNQQKSAKKWGIFIIAMVILIPALSFAQTVKTSGYIQNSMIKSEDNKAFLFGFERVRVRFSGTLNELMNYKLQVDFTDAFKETGNDGSTPAMINYAEIIFTPIDLLNVSVGKFKTPIGMEWNTGPTSLDFVKRGLGQALIFHFDAGMMAQTKSIGKYGFKFTGSIFNYGPNKATDVGDPSKGNDYTIAGRIAVDPSKKVHAETFFGSALTSVEGQENVNVYGAGLKWKLAEKLQLKGEFLDRTDAQNSSADGTDYYAQAGYTVHPHIEAAIKYEKLDLTNKAKDQANITLGTNFFLNSKDKKQSKILVNYVISDLKGNDAIQVMFQAAF